MNSLVSIIVPAYNAELTLERCLHSLRAQSYRELEIIVVNDGSSDHTKEILDKYEALDPRFRMIHKPNSGVSASRNVALALAHGTYIQFVDSDDWLAPNATEQMVRGMERGCELMICDYNRVVESTITVRGHIDVEGILSRKEYATYFMKAPSNYYYGVLWNKLFRTDIIRTYGLAFPNALDYCEDLQFNLEYLQYVKQVCVLHQPFYYYVRTKGSLSRKWTNIPEVLRIRNILFARYKELYEVLDLYEEHKLRLRSFYVDFARDKHKALKMVQGVPVKELSARELLRVAKLKSEKARLETEEKRQAKKHKRRKRG